MTGRRVDVGGAWIDRSRPIGFTFDGRELTAFEGDTLASALLANGVDVVCRSPILGRPRGVYSAGVEEPCAFVEVSAPRMDPIAPATTVDVVQGLVATGRPGVGRVLLRPKPSPTGAGGNFGRRFGKQRGWGRLFGVVGPCNARGREFRFLSWPTFIEDQMSIKRPRALFRQAWPISLMQRML